VTNLIFKKIKML